MEVGLGSLDGRVFWAVATARFLLPLAIPRYPLPAILASLILDAIDQTLFQAFTTLSLDHYQGYDKALDIYYLSIAYVSTLRNWAHRCAFGVSRTLFYMRLVGVAFFELTGLRYVLLVLPNAFEYYFVSYEAYRLRWDPRQMHRTLAIVTAAVIWIAIKLPQEYWIHVAQGDVTDWLKSDLLHFPADTPWMEILKAHPGGWITAFAVALVILAAAWRWVRPRLPAAGRRMSFSSDAHQPKFSDAQVREALAYEARHVVDVALLEKLALVTLVCVSFGQVLPDTQSDPLQPAIAVAVAVMVNTALSHWLARRGFGWAFTLRQLAVMAGVNLMLAWAYSLLQGSLGSALLLAVLLTLLVTLYDRYRQVYLMRFGLSSGRGSSRGTGMP